MKKLTVVVLALTLATSPALVLAQSSGSTKSEAQQKKVAYCETLAKNRSLSGTEREKFMKRCLASTAEPSQVRTPGPESKMAE